MVLLCWVFTLISLFLTPIHYGSDEVFSVGVYDTEGVLPMAAGEPANLGNKVTKDDLMFFRKKY